MRTGKPLKGKALVRAEGWYAVLRNIEQWDSEPDGRLEVSAQIKRLIAAIRKDEAIWALGSHRTSAAVAREVFTLCKFSDHAGIWPNGLLDALRLVLNVPATATLTTEGEHTDAHTPLMKAISEYWKMHPEASAYQVGQQVRNSRGNRLGLKGVQQQLCEKAHPGFAEHVNQLREAARKPSLKHQDRKAVRRVRRRRAAT